MAASLKPIKVWGVGGPNPPKVAIILEELGVPFEEVAIPFSELKKPEFESINPNGRLPAIYDPNTDLTLWESGAIVEYLIEKYDTKHALSFAPGTADYFHAKQWLFYQTTGQGPYFGQAAWFKKFHPERLPGPTERYIKEVNRVSRVLEGVLAKKAQESGAGPWLVGNKISYADIAFIPWNNTISVLLEKDEYNVDDYPHLKDWFARMAERPAVKKHSQKPL